ncbi:lytic murein transglycosylase [Labrys monachus]|uniref:Membrane-bound lytic murein transglycosylase B n=1 Tax=Labrys monachus TaxID=217067 RepID=A0ABU0FNJ9_9HYPH|nr:lytic murein transglycosylase [Labrys monachus]MDQ0396193.1 membrane-bound lytic murein transglycosylase B [Labrys monachus]
MPRSIRILLLALAFASPLTPACAAADRYLTFLTALWPRARAAGISRDTFDAAFAGLSADPKVIALAGTQPEFNQTIHAYIETRLTPGRISQGRLMAERWKPWLDKVEARFGVDRYVVLAIWSLESNYGASPGRSDIIRSLATLACCTGKRPELFRDELIAALKILQEHDIAPRAMTGSWAGALGQVQFMPSSFLKFAVDMNGDGKRNIWSEEPDVLGSIANYLKMHDWAPMRRWGYEVRLPRTFDFTAINAHDGGPIPAWADLGLVRADGQALPADGKAWLFLPAGAKGPAFLISENYWAIKSYNISDSYTLSVGLLADRLRGGGPLKGAWPAQETPLDHAQVAAMQEKLRSLGYPIDTVDGKIGPAVRTALRSWQASVGLTADGYPTPAMLQRLGATP